MYHELIKQKMNEIRKTDKSFMEKTTIFELVFGSDKISRAEAREIWLKGRETGMWDGIHMVNLEGQRIMLDRSPKTRLQDEFLQKHYELCARYGCAIQFHPEHGMCVIDRNYGRATMAEHDAVIIPQKI